MRGIARALDGNRRGLRNQLADGREKKLFQQGFQGDRDRGAGGQGAQVYRKAPVVSGIVKVGRAP